MTRVLVLGATGMLGHEVFRIMDDAPEVEVWGTVRQSNGRRFFAEKHHERLLSGVDALDVDALVTTLDRVKPDLVVNCIGIIKQLASANDPLVTLPINAILPHRLSRLCGAARARLVHISTDCVFSGRQGNYVETDVSDATDLYGRSKYLGEVHDASHTVTLRTSIIGHELASSYGLVDWFLTQEGRVSGYTRAIFSGLPAGELARVIRDVVLPQPALHGLYHVSAQPIAKSQLLRLIAAQYDKRIDIVDDDSVAIDRSLDSSRFTAATGYRAAGWEELIAGMHRTR